MTRSATNPKVDAFLSRADQWQAEMSELRSILLGLPLTEVLKWGKPCYAYENKNVVLIQGFKDSCALLFFKGVLLKDPDGVLDKVGENSRIGRQIRFTSLGDVVSMKKIVKAYVSQAIDVEKAGLTVEADTTELEYPDELRQKFEEDPALEAAFEALTPGRQRGYVLHFSAPKQSATRTSRIEKSAPDILAGRGLHDR
jgi:uncharacterized protein YdeI (YjbR/CyaY-like superfamily)